MGSTRNTLDHGSSRDRVKFATSLLLFLHKAHVFFHRVISNESMRRVGLHRVCLSYRMHLESADLEFSRITHHLILYLSRTRTDHADVKDT
jgi:hypothetical protein